MAGRLAPFIELGVGFNVELTARENVVLNGVMMGLTKSETQAPARLDRRFRRTRRVHRPEAEELLLGDAGPPRLLADDAGRRRRAADRRGPRRRRRGLPAEVRRRVPRDESEGQDDRPRHPLDGHRQDLLRPGDADRRRRPDDDRRPDRGRRPVPAAELRADDRRGGRSRSRSKPRRSACSTSGPRARPGRAARRSSRARGWSSAPSSRSSATCARRASASC